MDAKYLGDPNELECQLFGYGDGYPGEVMTPLPAVSGTEPGDNNKKEKKLIN